MVLCRLLVRIPYADKSGCPEGALTLSHARQLLRRIKRSRISHLRISATALVRASCSSKKINTQHVRPEIGFKVHPAIIDSAGFAITSSKYAMRGGGQEIRTDGLFGYKRMCLFYPDPAWAILGKCVELRRDPLLACPSLAGRQNRLFCASQLGTARGRKKKNKAHASSLVVLSYWSYCKVPRRLRLYVIRHGKSA